MFKVQSIWDVQVKVFSSIFQQSLKKKKKSEGKLSEKDEMGEKEKNAIEAQLAKEAEIRNRLLEVSFCFCTCFILPDK